MSVQASELGHFVDDLFNNVFYHTDDKLSETSIREGFDPDMVVRYDQFLRIDIPTDDPSLNGQVLSCKEYVTTIEEGRTKFSLTINTCHELMVRDVDSAGIGHVAHVSTFTIHDKKSGVDTPAKSVTLAKIAERFGKKTIVELTEILA